MVVLGFLVIFASTMTGYIMGVNAKNEKNMQKSLAIADSEQTVRNQQSISEKPENERISAERKFVKTYVLREDNGKAALFFIYSDGSEKLYKVYDISVSLLPKSDRELLQEGIEADSLSEALQFIEDYS